MSHRPSESKRRDIMEKMIAREIKHEESRGKKPDERKIRGNWQNVVIQEDRKRGW